MNWDSVSKRIRIAAVLGIAGSFGLLTGCNPSTLDSTFSEDFTSATQFDQASSTGLWNSYEHAARAPIVSGANAAYAISFGDGSDGAVDSSTGYTFNTDTQSVYNFQSLRITGGTITVTGSRALIIRSQGEVTITPTIDISGAAGIATGTTTPTGNAGGVARAGAGNGGKGGDSVAGAVGLLDGGSGVKSDGTNDSTTPGTGSNAGAAQPGNSAGDPPIQPGVDFDVSGFISGTGGGGGGGFYDAGDTTFHATGGSGGAGGGMLRISALGPVSVGTILARGGSGGDSAQSLPSGTCSGPGAGGGGGAVWIQSPVSVTSSANPDVTEGTGVTTTCPGGNSSSDGWPGSSRADTPTGGAPAWGTGNKTLDTDVAGTYTIVSKAYDLGTLNAKFTGLPVVTATLNGGSVSVEFAGSKDGTTFSGYTTDISVLSDQNYRYLKFRLSITVVGTASPKVSKVQVTYNEGGIPDAKLSLSAGCGTISKVGPGGSGGNRSNEIGVLLMALWMAGAWATTRFARRRTA